MPPYETQNFQLPLSGSRTLTQHAFGAMASVTAFQLPLSGSLHARQRLDDSRHSRYPFNSLSRDHEIWPRGYVINRESELSTPSLGITSRLSRRPFSCADMASFQLPLSGSLDNYRAGGNNPTEAGFQLPLSGSRQKPTEPLSGSGCSSEAGFQLPLSGSHGKESSILGETTLYTFNSLSRDHFWE